MRVQSVFEYKALRYGQFRLQLSQLHFQGQVTKISRLEMQLCKNRSTWRGSSSLRIWYNYIQIVWYKLRRLLFHSHKWTQAVQTDWIAFQKNTMFLTTLFLKQPGEETTHSALCGTTETGRPVVVSVYIWRYKNIDRGWVQLLTNEASHLQNRTRGMVISTVEKRPANVDWDSGWGQFTFQC